MREYELRPEAYTDLDEIAVYTGGHSNADTAKRIVDEVFKAISVLAIPGTSVLPKLDRRSLGLPLQ